VDYDLLLIGFCFQMMTRVQLMLRKVEL